MDKHKITCLKRISLPKATLIKSEAFRDCRYLETLITPELTVIEDRAFYYCSALSSIDVSKVISVGSSAFDGCNSILSITFDSLVDVGSSAFGNLVYDWVVDANMDFASGSQYVFNWSLADREVTLDSVINGWDIVDGGTIESK
ncbi:MAG: leucine-rich repeat protein [Rikenellaceae bacterium]